VDCGGKILDARAGLEAAGLAPVTLAA